MEPIGHALGSGIDLQPLHELWILRGNADRATARVAVMAMIRSSTERVIIFDVERLVAVEGDERRGADVASVGAQR